MGNLDECERALDEFFRGAPVRDDLTGFSTSALGPRVARLRCSSTEGA